MDNAIQAIMMAFGAIVFVIALSLAVYLVNEVTETSKYLTYFSDSTRYYDNIQFQHSEEYEKGIRYVSAETIIPTLYRYNKENFCVKIYDADDNLIQIFDVNLEGKVRTASADTTASQASTDPEGKAHFAYKKLYNDNTEKYYLFGAPWLGSTEDIKTRVDLFISGSAGYINNVLVDYRDNTFAKSLEKMKYYDPENPNKDIEDQFTYEERFISYSYTGETFETEDGDTLVTGASSKDKIVIIYKLLKNP